MKYEVFEGKTEEEAKEKALTELNISENECLTHVEKIHTGLLKKESVKLYVYKLTDIVDYLKEYLESIVGGMGIKVTFESKIRDEQITIKMYSDNNKILIGHNGQTLTALTTICKQVVMNEIKSYPYLILDVENYKEKQVKYLERLAKNIAREVKSTHEPVELENMNSYERRVIHNILTDDKYVYTESTGEEPNRHVVIKPKENK